MTKRVKVIVDYGLHQSKSNWKKGELFCPNCGKQGVWEEQGDGDYYEGPNFICVSCESFFHLPSGCGPRPGNDPTVQTIAQLRKAE